MSWQSGGFASIILLALLCGGLAAVILASAVAHLGAEVLAAVIIISFTLIVQLACNLCSMQFDIMVPRKRILVLNLLLFLICIMAGCSSVLLMPLDRRC